MEVRNLKQLHNKLEQRYTEPGTQDNLTEKYWGEGCRENILRRTLPLLMVEEK
jgi:hypothetical protein